MNTETEVMTQSDIDHLDEILNQAIQYAHIPPRNQKLWLKSAESKVNSLKRQRNWIESKINRLKRQLESTKSKFNNLDERQKIAQSRFSRLSVLDVMTNEKQSSRKGSRRAASVRAASRPRHSTHNQAKK